MIVVAMDFNDDGDDHAPPDFYVAGCGCRHDSYGGGTPCDEHRRGLERVIAEEQRNKQRSEP